MNRDVFAMSRGAALEVFARTGVLRIAAATPQGPLLRTVDGVVVDGALCFHGGDHGDKLGILDREVMVTADETIAHLPSWFFDERRACPATTYYRSVHAWGRVERLHARDDKAVVLQALMERFQPEGRYQPLAGEDPYYGAVLDKLLVARIQPTKVIGKAKLGQHKGARTILRALAGLWERGAAGDLRALRAIREAHPARPRSSWSIGPADTTLEVAPDAREVDAAVALVAGHYWNEEVEPERIRAAHLASPAWVVAKDDRGRVVGTARAIGDDAKAAIIYDVAVDPTWRGRGVGRALLELLLGHPRVRGARTVLLRTRDAQGFYATLGFSAHASSNELLSRRVA